jgi:5'(3')-deoxyribonucleotidase
MTKTWFINNERTQFEIFFDMDNTLLEMSKPLSGVHSGRLASYHAKTQAEEDRIVAKLHQKGLFKSFKPIYRAPSAVRRLIKNNYPVGIISQPMINEHCIAEKNYTLQKYFPEIDMKRVTYTFQKYLLANNNRILIDDHIEHLENWEKNGGIAICFERGYNKKWKGLRIKKHSELFSIIKNLEKGVI